VSDERDQVDDRKQARDDASEDLELTHEDADHVRGGVMKEGKIDLEKTKIGP